MNKMSKNRSIEIVVHLLIWLILFYIPVALTTGTDRTIADIALHFWLQLFLLAIIFYLNYCWFINKFLFENNRKFIFILLNSLLLILLLYVKNNIFPLFIHSGGERPKGPPRQLVWYMDFLIYLIPLAFAIAIQAGKRLTKMQVIKTEAENIQLQSELQHLKFQLQPHFFFNSLNNIYSLIDTDPKKAQQSIHSMSRLMRHLLQSSEAVTVSLSDEIEFLKKYIALMQLRLNHLTSVTVNLPETIPHLQVAPLLFISLVENAFKHGVSATQQSQISFDLQATNNQIVFVSRNTNFPKPASDLSGSGIGLSNLKKRLEIIYPGHYVFKTQHLGKEFIVNLTLSI